MKRMIIYILAFLVVCGLVSGGYFLGWEDGSHHTLILQAGTFVGSLDALDKIRAGEVSNATQRIEALCFSSANSVYGDFVFRHDFAGHNAAKLMIDDLRHYRQTYRTNSADWSPMERSLEKNLADWK